MDFKYNSLAGIYDILELSTPYSKGTNVNRNPLWITVASFPTLEETLDYIEKVS